MGVTIKQQANMDMAGKLVIWFYHLSTVQNITHRTQRGAAGKVAEA